MTEEIDSLLSNLRTVHEDLKPISTGIVVADWVRLKCRYGCLGYGSHFCCPPFAPSPQETMPGSFGVQICRAGQDPGFAFSRPNARLGQGSYVQLQDKAPEGRIRAGEKSLPRRRQKDGAGQIKSSPRMRYALSPGFIFKACRIR
jgi:hypothetical protein